MLLQDLVLAHLFLVGQRLSRFLALLRPQAHLLVLVGGLPTHFTFDTRYTIIQKLILVLNFANALALANALRPLCLFDFLLRRCCLLASLRIVVLLFLFLLLGEVDHSLLLLHDFAEPLDFELLCRACAVASLEALDLFDTLIVIDCLADDVLVTPVFGTVRSHLQLDFE